MYFVIIYLLLFLSKFTNSMDSHGTQQDEELVPFDHEFTETVQEFLKNNIKDFHLNSETRLRIFLKENIKEYSSSHFDSKFNAIIIT